MHVTRRPTAALRPFVERVWAIDARGGAPPPSDRERVVPTGSMHVVVRLAPSPLVLFEEGARPRAVGHALVGGVRSSFYVRSVSERSHSVGVQLRPGAASALLGVPAGHLAETHTSLEDLWGARAARVRAQLAEERSPEAALARFEALLVSELARRGATELPPLVAEALASFERGGRVDEAVRRSGYSHRTFLSMFRASVGIGPKAFCRVRRFQHTLDRLTRDRLGLAELAVEAGYADQAHLTREFVALAGVSPAAYRALAPAAPNHVPIPT